MKSLCDPVHVKLNIPEVISRAMNGQPFWAQAALGWCYFLEDAQFEEGHSQVPRYTTELQYFITLTNDGYLFFLTVVYFLI